MTNKLDAYKDFDKNRIAHDFDPARYDVIPSIHALHADFPGVHSKILTRMRDSIKDSLQANKAKIWKGYPFTDEAKIVVPTPKLEESRHG